MNIKELLLIGSLIISVLTVEAQILKKIESKINQRVNRTTEKVIDKGLDKIEEEIKNSTKNKSTSNPTNSSPQNSSSKPKSEAFVQSKFDFIPGDKVLFFDDFQLINLGDFPIRWNTNNNGEIVSLSNQEGKWLRIPDNTISFPELSSSLPENFTVEFDLLYPENGLRPPVTFGFSEIENLAKEKIQYKPLFFFIISPILKQSIGYSTSMYSGKEITQEWPVQEHINKPIHVSIAVNSKRIRLYMDEEKSFDLPRGFDQPTYRNNFHFRSSTILPKPTDAFYISNIRIAESSIDIRSSLENEGKFSTSGIYFELGSAILKPESHGILKEIAGILQQQPNLRLKVIGHTDNTGQPTNNLTLSLKRAESVASYLKQQFQVEDVRLEVSGEGDSKPIAANSTTEGRAQNRRVEFIRLDK